ncbi:MAG: site-specific integrase [Candidatus Margulisbacteria bacterium]|nr:site-specific integrase [Candidatus Margulisiibacteriota bacterium]
MFIKRRLTSKGITFHLIRKAGGHSTCRKIPARTWREAREYLRMYEGELVQGRPVSLYLEEVMFTRLAKEYQEYSLSRKARSTHQKDGSVIKALLRELGDLNLGQITNLKVQEMQSKWSKEGSSNKTINNRSILLGTMLRFAIDRNYLANLPKISKLKVDKKRPQFYTEEEIARILTKASPFVRDYVLVLLHTGLREGELKRLKWADVDCINRQIYVELSKSHKFRTIPMNDALYDHLIDLYRRKKEHQVYVFELNEGKPVSDFSHRLKKLLKRLGIEGHLHKLRHTFASRLVQKGVAIYEVQKLLGHASVQTTQVYAHVRMEDLQRSVRVLDFGRTVGVPS